MKNKNHAFLITTPRGLGELHRAHPKGWALEGTDKLVSTDDAYGSAYRAHQLHGWVGTLAKAAQEVWRDCEPVATKKKGPALPRAVDKKNLARLQGALSAVKEGYGALTPGRKVLGGSKLFASEEMLDALQKRHGARSLQGAEGFISWEMVIRDAKTALALESQLLWLFRAAAAVHAACRTNKGVPTPAAHGELGKALAAAGAWSWKQEPRMPRAGRPTRPEAPPTTPRAQRGVAPPQSGLAA